MYYAEGCSLYEGSPDAPWGVKPTHGFAEALAVAQRADVVVMCLGISPELEGEKKVT